MAAGLTLGFAGIAALGGCGDDGASSETSAPAAIAIGTEAASATPTSLAGVLPTTMAPTEATTADGVVVLDAEGGDQWMGSSFAGTGDYIGPPLEEVISRTTDAGIVVHAYTWPADGSSWPPAGGPGWAPAPWCTPSGSVRVTMRLDEAVGIGNTSTNLEPFGGISVQPRVAGYAEGTPFTVLIVQTGADVDSVAATFADGTLDAAETTDGLAVLAAPTAPAPEDMVWTDEQPPGPNYTLSVSRGADIVDIDSTELPFPTQADYQRDCTPPTDLPAPGEQPADPTGAEQAVRDAFAAIFDFADRPEGDRTWMAQLDSDEGVQDTIDLVLGGTFGSAAQSAEYTLGDIVFTSPTEAWFTYDLFANNNHFNGRFGLAVQVDGTWKISRGVICQDLALAGGHCEPAIGQLYPPTD